MLVIIDDFIRVKGIFALTRSSPSPSDLRASRAVGKLLASRRTRPMDLRFSPDEIAFRQEIRDFIRDYLPADIHAKMKLGHGPSKEDTVRWQRILNARGWAGLICGN